MVDELFDVLGDDAIGLRVHVQPAGGRTAVVGRHGDALKVRVAAPPEGGRANDACAKLVAETFGVAVDKVEVTSGVKSRQKSFRVDGVDLEEVRRILERLLKGDSRPGPEARQGGR